MLDWEIVESEEAPPPLPPEAPPGRSRLTWLWLIAVVLLIPLAAISLVRHQVGERRALMERDLRAVVQAEARARAFGLRQQALDYLAPEGVSRAWRSAFVRSFSEPGDEESLEIDDVTLDAEGGALVTLSLGGVPHLRYYRLTEDGWRRAPLPEGLWGDEMTLTGPSGLVVRFYERERAFAEQLAADLVPLTTQLRASGRLPTLTEIQIVPEELSTRVLLESPEGERLEVVSPLLLLPDGRMPAGERVRFEIALRLTSQTPEVGPPFALPHARRMLDAMAQVEAAHWALGAGTLATQRIEYRQQMNDVWQSPFVAPSGIEATAGAWLFADYLAQAEGMTVLTAFREAMADKERWDEVAAQAVGSGIYLLEEEAAALQDQGAEAAAALRRRRSERQVPAPQVRLTGVEASLQRTLYGQVEGLTGRIQVDYGLIEVELPGGGSLPVACAAHFGAIDAQGRWVEAGRRLEATSLAVTGAMPEAPDVAPLAADQIAAFVVAFDLGQAGEFDQSSLYLLSEGGEWEKVVDGPAVEPAGSRLATQAGDYLMLRRSAPLCNFAWYYQYDRSGRLVGQWLAEGPRVTGVHWLVYRPDHQDTLLILPASFSEEQIVYMRLDPEAPGAVRVEGQYRSSTVFQPIGWHVGSQRIVMQNLRRRSNLRLLDPVTGASENLELEARAAARNALLVDDGNTLLYVASSASAEEGGQALRAVDLETRVERVLFEVEEGEWIGEFPNIVGGHEGERRLLIPLAEREEADLSVRLVLINLDRPGERVEVAATRGNASFTTGLVCSQERVIYATFETVPDGGPSGFVSTLFLWTPTEGATPLHTDDAILLPWSCP